MNESEVVLSRSVKLEANPFRPKRDARSKDDDGLALLYSSVDSLSPQMQRVLSLLVEGHSNKEIAWRLSLKEATIKSHMSVIMKALGCRNRTQAALVAFCLASNLKPQLAKLRTSIGPR